MEETRDRPLVVITGGSGLIGTRVARALAPDHALVALDVKRPEGSFPADAGFVECDLTADKSVDEALRQVAERHGRRIASVIHLAAYYDFSGEPSPLYEELTVEGTRRLIAGLHEHFERVEQLVFSSSLLVMKPAEEGILDESSPVSAEWDYPQSKLAAEEVIRAERGDIPAVILRIAGAYDEGGHSPPLTQQIWRIREKKLESFLFPGNRSHGQSFVHLDDVARCIRAVVERRDALEAEELFLVGEPLAISYGALQDRIGELVHEREWPTLRIPGPVAKVGAWLQEKVPGVGPDDGFIKPWMIDLADAHYPVSIERARERLGWEPEHSLADVLPHMIAELERDPAAWYAENDLPEADAEDG